jgi:hypothetical protein
MSRGCSYNIKIDWVSSSNIEIENIIIDKRENSYSISFNVELNAIIDGELTYLWDDRTIKFDNIPIKAKRKFIIEDYDIDNYNILDLNNLDEIKQYVENILNDEYSVDKLRDKSIDTKSSWGKYNFKKFIVNDWDCEIDGREYVEALNLFTEYNVDYIAYDDNGDIDIADNDYDTVMFYVSKNNSKEVLAFREYVVEVHGLDVRWEKDDYGESVYQRLEDKQ